jgi:hypothetical protein
MQISNWEPAIPNDVLERFLQDNQPNNLDEPM